MDIISVNVANQALRGIKNTEEKIVGIGAEGRFANVDERLKWIESQTTKLKSTNSKSIDFSKGTFVNTEVQEGRLQLQKITTTVSSIVNVAKTSTATASGYYSPVINAIDDSLTTGWNAGSASLSNWILLDLQKSYTISRIVLTGLAISNYNLMYSEDNINFKTLTNQLPGDNKLNAFIYARYIKITAINTGATWTNITNLEVYADTAENVYKTSGTWESDVIDVGADWISTISTALNALSSNTLISTVTIATSDDGINFNTFNVYNPASPPIKRYLKMKVAMSAAATAGGDTSYEFDQSSIQNRFVLGDFVIALGNLQLKESYNEEMKNQVATETGKYFSYPIDTSRFKKINRIEVI